MGIDNPVKIFLSFIRATRPTLDCAEQPGLPIDALISALRGFVSLTVFDLGLFICGGCVVRRDDSLDCALP